MTDETSGFTPPEPPPDPAHIQQPTFDKRRSYTVEGYQAMFDGLQYLPNFEPLDLEDAAHLAASSYARLQRGYAKLPADPPHRRSFASALFILNAQQSGGWDGTGAVIVAAGWSTADQKYIAIGGKFAICQHKKVEGPGANHERGWHPGWCEKCGLNMNVDSGD